MKKTLLLLMLTSGSLVAQTRIDTVKVLMLISDTTHKILWFNPQYNAAGSYSDPVNTKIALCIWSYGYEVTKWHAADPNFGKAYHSSLDPIPRDQYVEHLIYLDGYKRPMPKYIVVWQTKTL